MTILFFARLFYPHIGGVETHVLEVGDKLAKQGHKIILVTEKISDDSLNDWQSNIKSANQKGKVEDIEARITSWEIYRIPVGSSEKNKKWKIWWWLWQNKRLIEKADVIHCHDVFFWYLPFKFLYKEKPVFTTFHGYETKFPPAKNAITIRRWSEKLSWGNICVGDFIKKWYGTRPDFVTYGGVDVEAMKTLQNEPLYQSPVVRGGIDAAEEIRDRYLAMKSSLDKNDQNINTKKTRNKNVQVIFIGRLASDTGILAYDQAITLLNKKNKHKRFDLTVVGGGRLKNNIENSIPTASYEQNIYPYIKNAHIVFASSYLIILQALAMRKPIIAFYDNPLKEDYLRMSPFARWIYIENSSEKIASRVLQILEEKEPVAQKLKEAYLWVNGQTWDNVTSLYLKLWKRKMQ